MQNFFSPFFGKLLKPCFRPSTNAPATTHQPTCYHPTNRPATTPNRSHCYNLTNQPDTTLDNTPATTQPC